MDSIPNGNIYGGLLNISYWFMVLTTVDLFFICISSFFHSFLAYAYLEETGSSCQQSKGFMSSIFFINDTHPQVQSPRVMSQLFVHPGAERINCQVHITTCQILTSPFNTAQALHNESCFMSSKLLQRF